MLSETLFLLLIVAMVTNIKSVVYCAGVLFTDFPMTGDALLLYFVGGFLASFVACTSSFRDTHMALPPFDGIKFFVPFAGYWFPKIL